MDIITRGLNYDTILQHKFNCWQKKVILQNIKRTSHTPLMGFFKRYCKIFNPMTEKMLIPLHWLIWYFFNDEDTTLFQNLYKLVKECAPISEPNFGSMIIIPVEQKLWIINAIFNREYSSVEKHNLNYRLKLGLQFSYYPKDELKPRLEYALNWWKENELNRWIENE